jgi:PhnB protein
MADVKPIPDNYPRVTPYLHVDGAAEAIKFYEKVFGAKQRGDAMEMPGGKIGHAEFEIGDSLIMIADEAPDFGALSPKSVGGTPVMLTVYVEDVDAVFQAAVDAGAKSLRDPETQFYGDRMGQLEDPFGHRWSIGTHVEDVSPEEMQERAAAAMGGG